MFRQRNFPLFSKGIKVMAKDEISRAARAEAGDVVGAPKQQDVAALLKKMKVAEADAKVVAHADEQPVVAEKAPAQIEAQADAGQMVASADSIFASDVAPVQVAMLDGGAVGGAGGGVSTGTLLAIGGVALVGGGIAIAANNDSGGGNKGASNPTVESVAAASASVNEGQTVVFTVTGTPGATFAWAVDAAHQNDVAVGSGTVTIGADGKGYVTVSVAADNTTEGAESFKLSVGGVDSGAVSINDTSVTPPIVFTTSQNETLTGTAGNDVFSAPLVGNAFGGLGETFQNGDHAIGGGGNDVLNLSMLGSTSQRALEVDTQGIKTVNIGFVQNNNTYGPGATDNAYDLAYLSSDVTTVSVTGDNKTAVNNLYVSAEGASDISLTNMNTVGLGVTADVLSVSVTNDRTAAAAANYTDLTIRSTDGGPAATTLNLAVDSQAVYVPYFGSYNGGVAVHSDDTEHLNLALTAGQFATYDANGDLVPSTAGYVYFENNFNGIQSNLSTVTITGTGDLYLNLDDNNLTSLDASGLQGGIAVDGLRAAHDPLTGDSLLLTINGGQGDDYISTYDDGYFAYFNGELADGATVNLNAGDDVFISNSYNDGDTAINGGAGDDVIAVAYNFNGTLTVDGGSGDDAIYIGVIGADQVTLTGGDGDDLIDLNEANFGGPGTPYGDLKISIDLGAGDDTLNAALDNIGSGNLLSLLTANNYDYATQQFTANVSANGGAGSNDTIQLYADDAAVISYYDVATNSNPDGIFNASISGFERVEIVNDFYDLGMIGGDVLNVTALDNVQVVAFDGFAGYANYDAGNFYQAQVLGLNSGATVELHQGGEYQYGGLYDYAYNNLKVVITDATVVGHDNDVLNVALHGDTVNEDFYAKNMGYVQVDGVETLNISTSETDEPGLNDPSTYLALYVFGDNLNTVTVSGDTGLDFAIDNDNITTFNASGVTAGSVYFYSNNTTAHVTITGGAGDDYLYGNDVVGVDATKGDVIIGGAGDDHLGGGQGWDTLTGGAGDDTFVVAANTSTSSVVFAKITDFSVTDDVLDLSTALDSLGLGNSFVSEKINLAAPTNTFADYLDFAASQANGLNNVVSWFQFDGNTYVVVDNSAGASSFDTGFDQLVQLNGLKDLSGMTLDTSGPSNGVLHG